jgi:septum formation protein
MRAIVLGSGSARRRELLKVAGLSFTVARPDIDETPGPSEPPAHYVLRLSREKAAALPAQSIPPNAVIITADTTVVESGEIIGKPADPDEARAMLRRLRGHPHHVLTGVSVRDTATGHTASTLTETSVNVRDYTDAEIEAYIASGDPFDKAGAYAVQHPEFRPVASLDGCLTNVIGLPLCTLCAMLREVGIEAPHPPPCSPQRLPCTAPMP